MKNLYFLLIALLLINFTSFSQNKSSQKNTTSISNTLTPPGGGGGDPIDPDPIDPGPTEISGEVGVTLGNLDISSTGASNYNVPILVPTGINGVEPKLSLIYSSQSGVGLAGFGWNVSGLSAITRIASTKFHDGKITAVDLNANDRFALDGQRLIVKNGGVYGANGTEYSTEQYSNVKITSFVNGTNQIWFKVEYPDGSTAIYGDTSGSRSLTVWGITSWTNPQGIAINYAYTITNNFLYINSIKYGSATGSAQINEVQFVYKTRNRIEESYIAGQKVINNQIISQIKLLSNNVGFKNYYLDFGTNAINYERLITLTEKSGDNLKAYSPITFYYNETQDIFEFIPYTDTKTYNSLINWNYPTPVYNAHEYSISGDFNGDGAIDKVDFTKKMVKITDNVTFYGERLATFQIPSTTVSNQMNILGERKSFTRLFCDAFPTNYLTGNSPDYKFGKGNGWCEVTFDETSGKTFFDSYSLTENVGAPVKSQDTREFTFPKACFYENTISTNNISTIAGYYDNLNIFKEFYSGDFNGDGITDAIAIERGDLFYESQINLTNPSAQSCPAFLPGKVYFINLDKRIQNNFVNDAGNINITNSRCDAAYIPNSIESDRNNSRVFVTDVTGDGKTDLVVFRAIKVSGSYPINTTNIDVYSLNDLNVFVKISTTNLPFMIDNYLHRTISSGDFNGDGKTDFLYNYLSTSSDTCKLIISTGTSFEFRNTALPCTDYNRITVMDFDNDGKSDILMGGITAGKVTYWLHKNINGNFNNTHYGTIDHIQYFGTSEQITTDMTNLNDYDSKKVITFHGISKGYKLNYNKDYSKEKLLINIVQGRISESIVYTDLSLFGSTYVKPPTQIENYPNTDMFFGNGFKVVSDIYKISDDLTFYKAQKFRYFGGVSNLEGFGFLGFRAISRTNWFADDSQMITSVTKFDPSKRSVPVEMFSMLGPVAPNYTLLPSDSYISRTLTTYNNEDTSYINPLQPDKVFKLYPSSTKTFNGLTGTSSETKMQYTANNSPLQITTTIKNGVNTEQISTTTLGYDPVLSNPYMIDRPLSKNITVSAGSDTTTSEELYNYNVNLLKQVKKKRDNTNYITEDNEYDSYGNITKKTISVPNLPARISNFEYDATSHRFLTKKKDIEGLETTYVYDQNTGWLLSETLFPNSANPLKIAYDYDVWGKLITKTNYLGTKETYTYANYSDGNVLKTNTNQDGSVNKTTIDYFGREVKKETLNLDGTWSIVETQYDIYDKVIRKTQPSIGAATSWNEMQYDVYGRVSTATALKSGSSAGKITNYSYSGLSITENDGYVNKVTVNNALGKVASVLETPGGLITYIYFANGNLKTTNFSGATITIEQDGWGRKTKLDDPSAGVHIYKYNDFGELTEDEVVGKGKTIYDLNDVGKPNSETMKDATGAVKSLKTYTYDPIKKVLNTLRFDDYGNSTFTLHTYNYDNYMRIISTDEDMDQRAKFTKVITFDAYGRVLNENYTAKNKADGKTSNQSITHEYKNGNHWKIINDATGLPLLQTNTVNADGKTLTATLGNGITITNTYDNLGFPTQMKHMKNATNIMTLVNTFDPIRGNLTSRSNNMFGAWSETLTYDTLDRLTSFKDVVGNQTQTYNDNGTISGNALGSYAYQDSSKPFRASSITPVDQSGSSVVLNYYIARPQYITYNVFKNPVTITDPSENIDFEYNAFNGRTAMYYGGVQAKAARPYRKYYSADGSMEIKVKSSAPASVEFVTYLGGDAYSAPVILKSDGTTPNLYYLHRDYQGTIVGITNATAVIVEKRLFDVWGGLIKYANNSGVTTIPTNSVSMFLDRGYTGHEHLIGVGLINMNGRIYDPKIHRFLQPDNNVQSPFNTQNYNRYGYCMNNPTKYTDQSGEFWGFVFKVVQFLVSAYVHGAHDTGHANPADWNAGQFLNAGMASASPIVSTFVSNGANSFIESYGKPSQDQLDYMKNNPIVENHGYVNRTETNEGASFSEKVWDIDIDFHLMQNTQKGESDCTYACKLTVDDKFKTTNQTWNNTYWKKYVDNPSHQGLASDKIMEFYKGSGYKVNQYGNGAYSDFSSDFSKKAALDFIVKQMQMNRVVQIGWRPTEDNALGHASDITRIRTNLDYSDYIIDIMNPAEGGPTTVQFSSMYGLISIWR